MNGAVDRGDLSQGEGRVGAPIPCRACGDRTLTGKAGARTPTVSAGVEGGRVSRSATGATGKGNSRASSWRAGYPYAAAVYYWWGQGHPGSLWLYARLCRGGGTVSPVGPVARQ